MGSCYEPQEMELDLVELGWRLLAQWKAILIVALVFAVLVPSVMYVKGVRDYRVEIEAQTEHAKRITNVAQAKEDILSELEDAERPSVEQAMVYDGIINEKQEYLTDSLLVNLNTDEASTVSIGYALADVDDTSMQSALTSGYSSVLTGDKALNEIMEAMTVDSELRYIGELISIEGNVDEGMAGVIHITIICPEASVVENVIKTVDKNAERANKKLSGSVTEHDIKRIYVNITSTSPDTVASAKTTALNDLYNLKNIQRSQIDTFTEEQKSAYEELNALEAEVSAEEKDPSAKAGVNPESTIEAPGFSKKYALVGFILGMILYAGIYVLWQILSRRIGSAAAAEGYTGARLLGEYYHEAKRNKTLAFFFHTKAVTKHRYGGKMDLEVQASKIANEIDASCENKDIQQIALLQVFENENAAILTATADKLKTPRRIINAHPSVEASDLADKEHAVFFVSGSTTTAVLDSILSLCADYGIERTGIVFVGEA